MIGVMALLDEPVVISIIPVAKNFFELFLPVFILTNNTICTSTVSQTQLALTNSVTVQHNCTIVINPNNISQDAHTMDFSHHVIISVLLWDHGHDSPISNMIVS